MTVSGEMTLFLTVEKWTVTLALLLEKSLESNQNVLLKQNNRNRGILNETLLQNVLYLFFGQSDSLQV